jgi:hypothetical protein
MWLVVELEEAQLRGSDGGRQELVRPALVLRVEEEVPPVLLVHYQETLFELHHVLQHQLLLWGVVPVAVRHGAVLAVPEVLASLQLLVEDVLLLAEDLFQAPVHIKNATSALLNNYRTGGAN